MSATPTASRRRKPQEFCLPDGRRVVVALPEDAAALREKYGSSTGAASAPEVQVEVVLHGSDEHRNFLVEAQAHHERRRAELRQRHGEAFDEWEDVHSQLDAVSAQLDRLVDQAARLNANFSKFGYDAQLRTYDAEDGPGTGSPTDGGANTPRRGSAPASRALSVADGSSIGGRSEWEERIGGETIKLFKRPVIKQYFHKGLLWRASEETQVMCFELFFDLLYGMLSVSFPSAWFWSHADEAAQSASSTSTASTWPRRPAATSCCASSSPSSCRGRSGPTSRS